MALMFYSEPDDPVPWIEALGEQLPDLEVRVWPEIGDASEIRFALVWQPPRGLLAGLPNLQAILSLGAGVEHILADPDLPRDVPLMRIAALGYVLLALLMAHVYPKGYAGGAPASEGLRFGAFIGLIATLPRSLVLYAMEGGHTGTLVIVDASWHIVEQGIGGLVIALLHGRFAWGTPGNPAT